MAPDPGHRHAWSVSNDSASYRLRCPCGWSVEVQHGGAATVTATEVAAVLAEVSKMVDAYPAASGEAERERGEAADAPDADLAEPNGRTAGEGER